MNRKQRRAMEKKVGKENSQKLAEKIFQFDQLPDKCLACTTPFDKKNHEMVKTWSVVVQDKNTVRLYCPNCWDTAIEIIDRFKEERING
jgi:predicted RNA-binding Zn-ribbon protein involved in translation (DUF1610 family)|tara:strand:+ start:2135 stop:2401 length:267 start_codon:yes stop_codon:yes gene_type:complete